MIIQETYMKCFNCGKEIIKEIVDVVYKAQCPDCKTNMGGTC